MYWQINSSSQAQNRAPELVEINGESQMLNRKYLLAAALTSASLAALSMPTAAWAQDADPNATPECQEAIFDATSGTGVAGTTVPDALQCGVGAKASAPKAVAVGTGANADGDNSTAIGDGAQALNVGSIALGSNANASGPRSVALGSGSIATAPDVISVGSRALRSPSPTSRPARLLKLAQRTS
jgi:trimeric autotransporter adhesin